MTYVIQRVSGRATVLNQVATDVLHIGRGTNCELRSENSSVALIHAQIEAAPNGYSIVDKGSVTGTYVNRKPVESALLAKGDMIEIGDLQIEVQLADAAKPMFLRVTSTSSSAVGVGALIEEPEAAVLEKGGALKAAKIDYATAYRLRRPYFTKVAVTAFLLIITFAVIGEIARPERQTLFMPGNVSSAHSHAQNSNKQPIAENCGACHDPWRGVIDTKCKACHGRAPHAEREKSPPSCMSCHTEHRAQAKLAIVPDVKCVACHGNLQAHIEGSQPPKILARITGFGLEHPDLDPIRDLDTLRFNHRLHLRKSGIANAKGQREILTCANCHKLVENRGKYDPAPLKFGPACQRCHTLTFDQRFPDAEVPHGGEPTLVYGYIVTTYAGNREIAGKTPEEIRRILTSRPSTTIDERALLNAEQVIKTKCQLCHDIQRRGDKLAATPPILPATWLQHAAFTHTSHREAGCEVCHDRARNSERTSDVLIPKQQTCVGCHGPQSGKATTPCATCHVYHERSRTLMTAAAAAGGSRKVPPAMPPTGDVTGMLQSVLLYTIVILLLVIMIPVGLALFTRFKAPPPERSAQRPASPSPAPPPAPARNSSPSPAPSPAAPKPYIAPIGESTQLVDKETPPEQPGGGKTEMVEWYGMLLCTAGALEGQRFIIEEKGLWIGRDPALAQIVINDSRISKRHVRIVPRNGRVHAIDVESTNGTFLNQLGERITDVQLQKGNTLILADNAATFLYQI